MCSSLNPQLPVSPPELTTLSNFILGLLLPYKIEYSRTYAKTIYSLDASDLYERLLCGYIFGSCFFQFWALKKKSKGGVRLGVGRRIPSSLRLLCLTCFQQPCKLLRPGQSHGESLWIPGQSWPSNLIYRSSYLKGGLASSLDGREK